MGIDIDDPVWGVIMSFEKGKDLTAETTAIEQQHCPHCVIHGTIIMHDGCCICKVCNTVVDRMMDYGAEWRFYSADDARPCNNPTRCFPPSGSLICTLGTVISMAPRRNRSCWQNRTEDIVNAQQNITSSGKKLQKYQGWCSMTYRNRALCRVFEQLSLNAAQHGIPSCIVEEAKGIYKRVSEACITRGDNRRAVIAVCMYVSCKKNGVPRSIKEIGAMFGIESAAMTKATHTVQHVILDADATSSEPSDFSGRFCCKMGLSEEATRMVNTVIKRADELQLVCNAMPPSIVGGSILMVNNILGLGLSKQTVASICMVAPTTVVKMCKRLEGSLNTNKLFTPPL